MKIDSIDRTKVTTSGVDIGNVDIQMNAKMYKILTDNMYQDKIGTIVRELSSNALDAHKDAGKEEIPFDIHLPTVMEPLFYIRDYGTGIPHEQFQQIYMTIGVSTKEETNDFLGGFGLGSKTPLTIADQYLVYNFYNGKCSVWAIMKDDGYPKIAKLQEVETDEPNGIRVQFAVSNDDMYKFKDAVREQYLYYPVIPNVNNSEVKEFIENNKVTLDTNDYIIVKPEYSYTAEVKIIVDTVAYCVNTSSPLYTEVISKIAQLTKVTTYNLSRISYIARVNIGDVNVTPSRETLEATDKTINKLTSVLLRIIKEYTESFIKDAKKSENIQEMYNELQKRQLNLLDSERLDNETINVKWSDEAFHLSNIHSDYKLQSYVGVITKDITACKYEGYSVRKLKHHYYLERSDSKGTVYIINDLIKNGRKAYREEYDTICDYVKQYDSNIASNCYVYVYSDTLEPKEIKELLMNTVGCPYVFLLSETLGTTIVDKYINPPKKPRDKNSKPKDTEVYIDMFTKGTLGTYFYDRDYSDTYGSTKYSKKDIKLMLTKDTPIYYLNVRNYTVTDDLYLYNHSVISGLQHILNCKIVICREKDKKVIEELGIKHLEPVITDYLNHVIPLLHEYKHIDTLVDHVFRPKGVGEISDLVRKLVGTFELEDQELRKWYIYCKIYKRKLNRIVAKIGANIAPQTVLNLCKTLVRNDDMYKLLPESLFHYDIESVMTKREQEIHKLTDKLHQKYELVIQILHSRLPWWLRERETEFLQQILNLGLTIKQEQEK